MSPACFDVIGNFVSITSKTLREDRTVADKKHVAYCDPPQAENLASEILFYPINTTATSFTFVPVGPVFINPSTFSSA